MPEQLSKSNKVRRKRYIPGSDVTTTFNVHVGEPPSLDEIPLTGSDGKPIPLTKKPPLVKQERKWWWQRGRGSEGVAASQPTGDKD